MTIYDMLCHGQETELPPLGGKWTPIANFAAAGASPSAEIFSQKYADFFSGKVDAVKKACVSIGGILKPALAGADITAEIPAFSFFPVLLQFILHVPYHLLPFLLTTPQPARSPDGGIP